MFKKLIFFLLLSFLVLILPLNAHAQSDNLILNPSFENGLTNWILGYCCLSSPSTYSMSVDTTTSAVGNTSVHLSSTSKDNNFWAVQPVYVEPNTNYVFAGHLKTTFLWPNGSAFFYVHKLRTGWLHLTYSFNSESDIGIAIRPQLEFANGQAWFDGLRLYRADNPQVNLITNPSFESNLSGWQFGSGLPGTYSVSQDASTVKDGAFSLKFTSTDTRNNFWGYQIVNLEPNTNYVFEGWMKEDNTLGKSFFNLGLLPSDRGNHYLGWSEVEAGFQYVGATTGGPWYHFASVVNSSDAGKFLIRAPELEWSVGDVWADGLSLYKDAVPANINFAPQPFVLGGTSSHVSIYIKIPEEFSLSEINVSSLTLNGVPADTSSTTVGDYNNNGIPDLQVNFPRAQFEQTITAGTNTISLKGTILNVPLKGTTTLIFYTPITATQNLITTVESFNLLHGIENSLDIKLQNALDSLTALNSGTRQDAINKLQAFIQAVGAQTGNQITSQQAAILINAANQIISSLSH